MLIRTKINEKWKLYKIRINCCEKCWMCEIPGVVCSGMWLTFYYFIFVQKYLNFNRSHNFCSLKTRTNDWYLDNKLSKHYSWYYLCEKSGLQSGKLKISHSRHKVYTNNKKKLSKADVSNYIYLPITTKKNNNIAGSYIGNYSPSVY